MFREVMLDFLPYFLIGIVSGEIDGTGAESRTRA